MNENDLTNRRLPESGAMETEAARLRRALRRCGAMMALLGVQGFFLALTVMTSAPSFNLLLYLYIPLAIAQGLLGLGVAARMTRALRGAEKP